MSTRQPPSFTVDSASNQASETLLCGLSEFGLAGLTAVDYLVEHLELEQVGHVAVEQLPTITPFEAGTPRHHTRLFSRADLDVTVLVGELFVPAFAAQAFADSVLAWADDADMSEVTVVSGVPTAHGPDDHRPFYIASRDYQRAHDLESAELTPMAGGFLDGFNGAVMAQGMDSSLRTAVLTTPAHPQVPDADAALRLLDAVASVYSFDVDTGPLEEFAAAVSNHYAELADRLAAAEEEAVPEDRMYM